MNNIEAKIGFDKIREMVLEFCTNELAAQMVRDMVFETRYDRIVRSLRQVEEMRQIMLMDNSFPAQDFIDMTPMLQHLRVGNTRMEQAELFDMKVSLHTIVACMHYFADEERAAKNPELAELASHIEIDRQIIRLIDKTIDDKGEIYDDATETLRDIRRELFRKRGEVDSQISRSLAKAKREGWAPENGEVTIRNGRMVIPMLDTHRRKMKGLIHDESATRQTAYLEPAEVVELNNDLRELEFAEKHEIQKILLRISDAIRPAIDMFVNAYWVLARIDFVRAKAKLAIELKAGMPVVNDRQMFGWLEARHPLLFHQREGKEVVPFDLTMDREHRILIISGPNAGGKSVCLKAIGLIQYMMQCGLLVPCRETSEFGVFDKEFIDIGDQQSIESDLSTYSSHLQNMKELLADADDKTLFLLDELGGGTEPRSGCAIAEAVLEELYVRGAYGVVTTHFADLKLMADRHEGIVNGAMLFDSENLRPLYRLAIGHAGSSFAFEIATNIGLPQEILDKAAERAGREMLNFEQQVQQLEVEKRTLAEKEAELEQMDRLLNEVVEKYRRLSDNLESRKYEILSKARTEAKEIVADANRAVEQTISDIKSAQAEKERTQQARERLRQKGESLAEEQQRETAAHKERRKRSATPTPVEEPKEEVAEGPIEVGDIVMVDGEQTYGQVVALQGKKAVVESNSVRMTIAINRLTKSKKKTIPADRTSRKNSRFQSIYDEINEKRKYFNPTLDVRGMRGEEALAELTRFLDEAQLLGERDLKILHGKGFGILKTMIRDYLKADRNVEWFGSEHIELGGDGITLVKLK